MPRQTSTPVIERKRRLDGSVVEYECERIVIEPGQRAVVRYVSDRTRPLEGSDLVLRPGTVTIGHFWFDRPYYVYHWLERDKSVAYYFSIAIDVRIHESLVEYTDLVVDVLVRPSGESTVLDEDELPTDLDPALRRVIAHALEAIATNPRRVVAEIERASREALRPPAGRTRS